MNQNTPIKSELPPPPLMIMRGVPNDLRQKLGQVGAFFLDAYSRMGPIFRFSRANQEFVVLAGYEANLFFLREAQNIFRADLYRKEQNEEFGVTKTLVTLNGEEHYEFRRIQRKGHSRAILNNRYPELSQIIRHITQSWSVGDRLLVRDFFPQMIAEQLGVGVVNYPLGAYFADVLLFVRTSLAETVVKMGPRKVMNTPEYQEAKRRSYELADQVIAFHRTTPPVNQREPDVVDDLLAGLAENPDLLTEQELRLAVLGGYIGGLDTVAYTCTFMLYALLSHPAILARVQREVDEAFADGELTPAKLREMVALHHTALETLRLYPVAAAIQGDVAKSFEFGGYRVEKGQGLIVATALPHFLPEFFTDPLTFDIDRYNDPSGKYRQPGIYEPFGLGPHVCLGAGMAEVLIMLTMATLLHEIQFEIDPPHYQLNIQPIPAPVPYDFYVRVAAKHH